MKEKLIQLNIFLRDYCNYKIGGPADYFLNFQSESELLAGMKEWQELCKEKKIDQNKFFIIGKGTNILFPDEGYHGLILRNSIEFINQTNDDLVEIGAGTSIEELDNYCIEHSLTGLEWSGGLPGTLGGAIFGNAGAFGGETKDNVIEVKSYDIEKERFIIRNNKECMFGYRTSIFKQSSQKEVVLSVLLKLKQGEKSAIEHSIKEKIAYRNKRQPLEYPNAGSTFKNIDLKLASKQLIDSCKNEIKTDPFPVIPVAYLIHMAKLSGKEINGAQISQKHPNFIINKKDATSEDIKELVKLVKSKLHKSFNIDPETEIIELKN